MRKKSLLHVKFAFWGVLRDQAQSVTVLARHTPTTLGWPWRRAIDLVRRDFKGQSSLKPVLGIRLHF